MPITLAQAEAKLAEWIAADTAVAHGQQVTIDGQAFTRADAAAIRENINFWNNWCVRLGGDGGMAINIGVPERD